MTKKKTPDVKTGDEKAAELLTHPSYEELEQKLNETEQKMNEYWDKLLRMQAETENAAKRQERDLANAHKYALEKFVDELLPIVDSLELCLTSVPDELKASAKTVTDGVELTLKMFYKAMEKFGVEQVSPLNEQFDPEFQQAISTKVDPDVAPNTVVSVLQKGYTLNSRMVRPALVVVSKAEE